MEKTIKKDVIIIGAGLTGLTLAHSFKKSGISFLIIEKAGQTGGVMQTINKEGFTFEAGPNTGVISHPEVVELFEELQDKCTLEKADPNAKKRLIWKNGRWNALPSGLIDAIRTPLFSWRDKFRILCEPFRKKGNNPMESLADMVVRRLGRSYLDYAVDPFISGIYSGDPQKLVTKYALPKLYRLEQDYGSFIIGSIKKARQPKDERTKKATREVFSAKGGLGNLIKALTLSVGKENILLNANSTTVKHQENSYLVETTTGIEKHNLTAPLIVSTIGGHAIQEVFPFLQKKETKPFKDLPYAAVTQIIIGFKKWNGMSLKSFGGLVPSKEKMNLLGALFTSSFLQERAPREGALISVFMGGIRHPEMIEWSDEQIQKTLEKELPQMLSIEKLKPDILEIFRYQTAIPQYDECSKERLDMIALLEEKYPGLILAGNIRDGIGMADRIKQARTIAKNISTGIETHDLMSQT